MALAIVSTESKITKEFKEYVDAEIYKFKIDALAGQFTFVFAFRKFQRVWAHQYIEEKYNLKSITIGPAKIEKIRVFKPGFKVVFQKVKFHPELIKVLKDYFNLYDFELNKYFSDMNYCMNMNEGAALEFSDPILMKLPANSHVISMRKQLPIWQHRKQFLRQVILSQVTIISGGPGIGKSTQVPQYVMEYVIFRKMKSRVICAYPYRLVAMAMAKRVSSERGEFLGTAVGYRTPNQIQHFSNTPVIFTTSELLLRTLINNAQLFATISHIVVDNVDVRDKYTDLLLLCLKRCLITYPKLKLILISGSADNHMFVNYFKGASLLNIPSPNTNECKLDEYFLEDLSKFDWLKLRDQDLARTLPRRPALNTLNGYFDNNPLYESIDLELICELILQICKNKPMGGILVYLPAFEDIKDLQELIMGREEFLKINYNIFFLHRMIDSSDQYNIYFKSRKTRKIIIGTALAESAYFMNDIYYVIDIGTIRETKFVAETCLSHVQMNWISQAAAKRRSARMGKNLQAPVECYRFYTRMEYRKMPIQDTAELLKAPITDLCLLSRAIISPKYLLHQFLNRCIQPPPKAVIDCSVKYLKQIGAFQDDESLTPWGKIMGKMPVEAHLTKMLMFGLAFNCIEPVVTIVSFISLRGPWPLPALPENQPFLANRLRQYSCGAHSDHLSLLEFFAAWQEAKLNGKKKIFCRDNFLRGGIMDLVLLKRNELLTQLYCLDYLQNAPSLEVEEYNEQGNSWAAIKACLTAGLAPMLAFVDRKGSKLKTNFFDNLQIGNQSINYRGLKNLPTDWLIYEATVPQNNIQNITCVNPFLLILFGSNCQWEMKDFNDNFAPTEHMSLFILNQWVYFLDKYSSLKTIIDIKKKIENHMLRFLAVPYMFPGADPDKIFNLLLHTLNKEDPCTHLKQLNFGRKPLLSSTRINYALKPFDLLQCIDVDCPSEFFLTAVFMECNSGFIAPVLTETEGSVTETSI